LLDRILAAFDSLPHDDQIVRDLLGTLRTLATVEPLLAERMRALAQPADSGATTSETIRDVIRQALAGTSAASDGAAPVQGKIWPQPAFVFQTPFYVRNRTS
jgi:hypothetical protein